MLLTIFHVDDENDNKTLFYIRAEDLCTLRCRNIKTTFL